MLVATNTEERASARLPREVVTSRPKKTPSKAANFRAESRIPSADGNACLLGSLPNISTKFFCTALRVDAGMLFHFSRELHQTCAQTSQLVPVVPGLTVTCFEWNPGAEVIKNWVHVALSASINLSTSPQSSSKTSCSSAGCSASGLHVPRESGTTSGCKHQSASDKHGWAYVEYIA